MKTKILISSLLLLFACNLYADKVHEEISELFTAVFKREFSPRLVNNLVAPHFDKVLRKELPDDLNNTADLTGKLFFFVLSEYLEANENKRNISFKVYLLPEGYRQDLMRVENSKLISVKARVFDTGTTRSYLVKVQMGLGIPSGKLIFISMWKKGDKFLIAPAECILGDKTFPEAAGQHYDIKSGKFTWDKKKLERFVNFLRKIEKNINSVALK
jgi:hypothetical protein